MAPLKFRCWNPFDKKMGTDITLDLLGQLEGLNLPHLNESLQRASELGLVIMQFTGLTDRKGAAIFEGDVLRCFDYYGKVRGDHFVKWEPHYDAEEGEHTGYDLGPEFTKGWCEIIGNVYENPELIPAA